MNTSIPPNNNQSEDTKFTPTNDDFFTHFSTPATTIEDLINNCKIDLSKRLEAPPVAMQIRKNIEIQTLFTKGNFSIITGPAKSRKSYLISMLIATAVKGGFSNTFVCPTKGMNLLFDTEQSRYKTQQIGKRITHLSETKIPENLEIYSLRTLEPAERIALIEEVLKQTPNINFVAIDGIIDLEIDPILQADQAQKIVSKLMIWTEIYNIHITCVLHYNKSVSTLLGHLGSFSHRKADAIIEVKKDTDNIDISIVTAIDCREKEFHPFAFSVDETGNPYIVEGFEIEKKSNKNKESSAPKVRGLIIAEVELSKHQTIIIEVFSKIKDYSYTELWRNIKIIAEKELATKIGDNKAKDLLTFYLQKEIIVKDKNLKNRTPYSLPGQAIIQY
jgi:hypothetical protein